MPDADSPRFQSALTSTGYDPAISPPTAVLIANGLYFTVMTVLFVWLGSAADYGSFSLYIISYIAYGATLVFYTAPFPRLARYMPHVRKARDEDLKEGKISQADYDRIESLEKNHLSNISTAHSNIGYLLTLAINLSVLLPLQGHDYANNWAYFLTNSYWIVLGIWWFIF
ncbi:MFS general substrate transporter [Neofusicoccum parvum]|uniref:MFS general substrate transporter n=1 Tax=Neofusicoccum parvum TaxID=310453 RepID=A0ACB5SEU5_9PEZI|nr:MFS general substrate transporter [Neofusicoccum parvum]